MDTKLTLKLDRSVIENAKVYAMNNNVSLSELIETYLRIITVPKEQGEVTAFVKSLSGVVRLRKEYNYKKRYKKHLSDKYAK